MDGTLDPHKRNVAKATPPEPECIEVYRPGRQMNSFHNALNLFHDGLPPDLRDRCLGLVVQNETMAHAQYSIQQDASPCKKRLINRVQHVTHQMPNVDSQLKENVIGQLYTHYANTKLQALPLAVSSPTKVSVINPSNDEPTICSTRTMCTTRRGTDCPW
jgi:hypothetical protein